MELTTAYWRRSISHLADFAKVPGPGESSFSEGTMKKSQEHPFCKTGTWCWWEIPWLKSLFFSGWNLLFKLHQLSRKSETTDIHIYIYIYSSSIEIYIGTSRQVKLLVEPPKTPLDSQESWDIWESNLMVSPKIRCLRDPKSVKP